MAGIAKVLIPETTVTGTTVYNLDGTGYMNSLGGHGGSTLLYNITAAGPLDVWTITTEWYPVVSTRAKTVHSVAFTEGTTALGVDEITLATDLDDTNKAIPMPRTLTVTATTPGASPTITFSVYMVHGD